MQYSTLFSKTGLVVNRDGEMPIKLQVSLNSLCLSVCHLAWLLLCCTSMCGIILGGEGGLG